MVIFTIGSVHSAGPYGGYEISIFSMWFVFVYFDIGTIGTQFEFLKIVLQEDVPYCEELLVVSPSSY